MLSPIFSWACTMISLFGEKKRVIVIYIFLEMTSKTLKVRLYDLDWMRMVVFESLKAAQAQLTPTQKDAAFALRKSTKMAA